MLLDCFNQISSLSIGYNAPALVEAAHSKEWVDAVINRPALGITPSYQWVDLVENVMMDVAPKGFDQVFTTTCGSCANETAYKAVFMSNRNAARNGGPISEEDLTSCMKNLAPGSPDLSILSFEKGFHGRLLGSLSATRSKAMAKVDIPAFHWPTAPFPQLKYPLNEFEAENAAEEARCLAALDEVIGNSMKENSEFAPVAAVVVEPIQAEGGDRHASPAFFKGIRDITNKHNVKFIADEVQTGGGPTGTYWAHEQWGEEAKPDVVCFSKKTAIAGFYHNMDLRPSETYRNFNTWLGEPVKVLNLQVVNKVIKEQNLLENTQITGQYLRDGLETISALYPQLVQNVRGQGTFIAYDSANAEIRDRLVYDMKQAGMQGGGCGEISTRMRPQLIFKPKHAALYLNALEDVCKGVQSEMGL
eukprot:TRINITY_DN1331_c0_g1_i4.p1 TRINITY_DN1331_c0_g1~~TRINITY_DN1331_c0_g1_i4.p1  ORF type:complete len:418 (+),score=132.13 TRINITY_DN1331_c0_g1_i4:372-1625(+)